MSSTETRWGSGVNAEAIQAWDGPLFDRFVKFRHIVTTGLGAHGDEALRLIPPQEGQRILDVGCGFGDTTQQIAALVGPDGEAVGVDAAPNFIETATAEAAEAKVENARFFVADVQTDPLEGPYDRAFSRMGTMFFISPVAALRNVRQSLVPGGELAWSSGAGARTTTGSTARSRSSRPSSRSQRSTTSPPAGRAPSRWRMRTRSPTCSSMPAGRASRCAAATSRSWRGNDIDEAIDLVMSIGPAGEILRLQGDRAAHLVPQVEAALREGLAEFVRDDGSVWAPASTWIVTATAPAG